VSAAPNPKLSAEPDGQARTIARAVVMHLAKRTGDVDTMRAVAKTLQHIYPNTEAEEPIQ